MNNTDFKAIDNTIDSFVSNAINLFLAAFDKAGGIVVAHAKETGNYLDHTTHLRSSVGYIVTLEGSIIHKGGFGGNLGGETGLSEAQSLIQGSGIELIVVAGMKYARYVEAKNYNVLTSAEHLAEHIVPQILKQLEL